MTTSNINKLQAERRSSMVDGAALAKRGKLIEDVASQSPLWQGALQAAGQDAIAACAKVADDEELVNKLQIQLDAAKSLKSKDEVSARSKLDVYFTQVEDKAPTAKEMQDLGIDPLVEHTYDLAAPLGITAKSDPALHDIGARVKRAPGMKRCVIEVSSDLTMQTGVKQYPGDGARQKMGPFPPGTYALRACHTRASDRSAYTDIVTVVVK